MTMIMMVNMMVKNLIEYDYHDGYDAADEHDAASNDDDYDKDEGYET